MLSKQAFRIQPSFRLLRCSDMPVLLNSVPTFAISWDKISTKPYKPYYLPGMLSVLHLRQRAKKPRVVTVVRTFELGSPWSLPCTVFLQHHMVHLCGYKASTMPLNQSISHQHLKSSSLAISYHLIYFFLDQFHSPLFSSTTIISLQLLFITPGQMLIIRGSLNTILKVWYRIIQVESNVVFVKPILWLVHNCKTKIST